MKPSPHIDIPVLIFQCLVGLHGAPPPGQARGLEEVGEHPRQGAREGVQEAPLGHQEEDGELAPGPEEEPQEQGPQEQEARRAGGDY